MPRVPIRLTVALFAFAVAGVPIPSAGATTSGAAIALSPSVGPPTSVTVVTGTGFRPDETVDVRFGDFRPWTVIADGTGSFRVRRAVPRAAHPGVHIVTAIGRAGGGRTHARFLVRTDWAQEGFTASHIGHNIYENVLDPSNVGDLKPKWLVPYAQTNDAATIAGGVIYVADAGSLAALRASNGKLLWLTYLGSAPSTATVSHGSVYVGTFISQRFFALDASTGAIRWSRAMGSYISNGPTVVNALVYVTAGGWLTAFRAATGHVAWRTSTGGLIGGTAIAHRIAYVHTQGKRVVALNANTGRILWQHTIGYGFGTPAVSGGTVYAIGGVNDMFAFDALTGRELWERPFPVSFGSPAVAYGLVYAGGADGNLYAFDAATGTVVWRGATGGEVSSSPAVANGVVYVWSEDSSIYAFDARTGAKLWSWYLGVLNCCEYDPVVADGVLYIGSFNGLHAFALPSGGDENRR